MMLRALETFIAVHRDGTFSRAGDRIGLTQSAVSAQIKKLETYLDAELFTRGQRHATLTDAGRRLVPLAEQLIDQIARLPRQIREDALGGRLRIGAIASVQIGVLADALAQFKRQLPGVDLRILPGVSTQLLEWVDAGETDLAVLVRPPFALPRELRWHLLWREPYALIAPEAAADPGTDELLRTQPFIRYDRSSYGGRLVQAFLARRQISVQDSMELDDLEAIICMVERGLGVSLIPLSPTLRLKGRALRIRSLDEADTFYREIGVIARRQRETDVICSTFVDLLTRQVPAQTSA